MQLLVAEKPSVARDIARVLGVPPRGEGCFRGEGWIVTWCVGHLVELDEPSAYDPAWKSWRLETLPMLPQAFRLRPSPQTASQWRVVRDLLRSREVTAVVNACDAGREGELIFRYCYELAGSQLPVRRLWISSMTDAALRAGLSALRPGAQYDALGDAARCRSEADWLVGMNATRAVTARFRAAGASPLFSIGRVQTPTLALVVGREQAIERFVPREYWEVTGTFSAGDRPFKALYGHLGQSRLAQAAFADAVVARASACQGPRGPRVESVERKVVREPPPLLFDLTSLQRTANRRFGLSAQRTLDIAQALYETHKLLTYPRTDSRHLSSDLKGELKNIFQALSASPDYAPFASHLTAHPPGPTPRVFNDARVTDHHAIIPTSKAPRGGLERDEQRIYDLVVRRFLGAFYPDAEIAQTVAVVVVGDEAAPPAMPEPPPDREAIVEALPEPPDRFTARGRVRLVAGWQEVAGIGDRDEGEGEDAQALPPISMGQRLTGSYDHAQKRTRPPPRYSEATLLSAMETAGREIEDEALRQAMKDCGLGTPATRASTIETLLKRGYLERQAKTLVPTSLGRALVDGLPVRSLASPELTGEWEARLSRMARGLESRGRFMADIAEYVRQVVDEVKRAPAERAAAAVKAGAAEAEVGPCPLCGEAVIEQFKFFSCKSCSFKLWKDIAGKRVSAQLARVLLARRKTRVLPGFRSKAGKRFSAALEIDETGAVRLAFEGASRDEGGGPEREEGEARGAPRTERSPGPRGGRAGGGRARASTRRPPAASRPEPPPPPPAAVPAPRSVAPPAETLRSPLPPASLEKATPGEPLLCPRCGEGAIIPGRRAWGCSRWREGCGLVVPFACFGRELTAAQLSDLITRGRTRKSSWLVEGAKIKGRLTMDVGREPPLLAVEPDAGSKG